MHPPESATWNSALVERDDLTKYGSNALGLFALILRFGLEDIESVASDAVVDGANDKKCDIVYIDQNERVAVVAQCYSSQKERTQASANKAGDLSTAIGWLLHAEESEIPERIRTHATNLRQTLRANLIDDIHIWYVHNLPENVNVKSELDVVGKNAEATVESSFKGSSVRVHVQEIGTQTLESLYHDTQTPILVTEEFNIRTKGAFELEMGGWKACVAAIPTTFLRSAYKKSGVRLFSANVRDYLGARRSDSNINNGIMQTARTEPENFWAYNNGITVLVNDFTLNRGKLTIKGLSVVNGAQTTGALGSVNAKLSDAWIPARFIKTSDGDVVSKVIRFNNSQNKVTAADFRSTDRVQKKLREEFDKIPDAEYEGGRRGGADSVIRRRKYLLPSFTVGQAVASFHGQPIVAYNEKTNIWERDALYGRYFNESTSASHIVLCFSLLRAVESMKVDLARRAKAGQVLTGSQNAQLEFLRNRGSTFLSTAAVAGCLEIILEQPVPNLFKVSFLPDVSPGNGQEQWSRIVSTLAPMFKHLEPALKPRLENLERVKEGMETFATLVEATAQSNMEIYAKFKSMIRTA